MRRRSAIGLVAFAVTGCGLTAPSRFYTLSVEAEAGRRRDVAIAVGEVSLPDTLDRSEIVTRLGPTQVTFAEGDRWAEPLEPMAQQILGQNLARITHARELLILPQRRDLPYDVLVEAEITRFDADAAGELVLDGRWRLFGSDGERLIASRETTLVHRVAPAPDYVAIVDAMSRALADLAQQIALEIPEPRVG